LLLDFGLFLCDNEAQTEAVQETHKNITLTVRDTVLRLDLLSSGATNETSQKEGAQEKVRAACTTVTARASTTLLLLRIGHVAKLGFGLTVETRRANKEGKDAITTEGPERCGERHTGNDSSVTLFRQTVIL
jgi:hypothetical protein